MSKRPWDKERKKANLEQRVPFQVFQFRAEYRGAAFQQEKFEMSQYFRELGNGMCHCPLWSDQGSLWITESYSGRLINSGLTEHVCWVSGCIWKIAVHYFHAFTAWELCPKWGYQWQRKWCQISYNISVWRFPMWSECSLKGQGCWVQSLFSWGLIWSSC